MRARMLARECVFSAAFLMALQVLGTRAAAAAPSAPERKTRIAIVGLDHDHVWGLLKYLEAEPDAELVAIAELQPALVKEAKSDRKSTRLNSSHSQISYAVFCLKKKKQCA